MFIIYTDRLREGKTETIEITTSPDFLAIDEPELVFDKDVHVSGRAYLANDHLILHLSAKTEGKLPCKICNEMTICTIEVDNISIPISLSEVKGAIYSFEQDLREAILLETPLIAECNGGSCPMRKKENLRSGNKEIPTYLPFADL